MAGERPFYAPDRNPAPPRHPTPGFTQWELRNGWHVLICEFRDDSRAGAGVAVQLIQDGLPLCATRCITGDAARYVAESYRQDHLRTGWRFS